MGMILQVYINAACVTAVVNISVEYMHGPLF